MQGPNFEKTEERGKWSLTGEEEAQSCRASCQLFFRKLSSPVPFKTDGLLEVPQHHSDYGARFTVTPVELMRLFLNKLAAQEKHSDHSKAATASALRDFYFYLVFGREN